MTVATPDILQLEARTDLGKGLSVPIAKALAHLTFAHGAIARGWDLNAGAVAAEIAEAIDNLNQTIIPDDLVTPELAGAIAAWTVDLTNESRRITREARDNDAEASPTDDTKQTLINLIIATWNLLALIDVEITGLNPRDVDPGRQP
jgi:hypothetical protein